MHKCQNIWLKIIQITHWHAINALNIIWRKEIHIFIISSQFKSDIWNYHTKT